MCCEYVGNGFLDPKAAYSILRKDRQDGKGGGVCAIVKGDINLCNSSVAT